MGWGTAAAIAGSAILGAVSSNSAAQAGKDAMSAAAKSANAQTRLMIEQYEKAVKDLEEIGIPSVESQRIALEFAQLGPSALEQISTDPRLAAEQYDSLRQLGELTGPGLTPEDRAEQFMITQSSSREAQARGKAIKQNMAQRGLSGSGIDLAAQLSGSQGAADRGAMQQAQLVSDRANAKRAAIMGKANLAGQMEQSQYGRDAKLASARDRIEQFNKTQRAGTMNQQEMANKALIQQDYQNRLSKAQAIANARAGQAGAYGKASENAMAKGIAGAKGAAQQGAAQVGLIGDLAGAGASMYSANKKYGGDDTAEDGGVMGFQDGGLSPYLSVPNSNGGLTEGGVLDDEGAPMSEDVDYRGGELVPGESYAGDRVDAKVNSGEMVINLEQQQRLMDLLKGLKDLQGLGDENIVDEAGGPMGAPPEAGLPPEGLPPGGPMGGPPAGGPPMIPDGQEVPFAGGGMVPAEYPSDRDSSSSKRAWSQPRGVHSSLASERKTLEAQDGQQKERKARIKALEVLQRGGK